MKTKLVTLVMLLASVTLLAQKTEVRKAERSIESGKFTDAQEFLKQAEPNITAESEKWQARFYVAKGKTYLNIAKKSGELQDLITAKNSFEKAAKLGEKEAANNGIKSVESALINSGIADHNAKKYKLAAKKLYTAYQMVPADTITLFAAANNSYLAENYDQALAYYNKLIEMGYQGNTVQYVATDKETGKEKVFNNKNTRDLYVKTGKYIKPETRRSGSKSSQIIKQVALLYLREDKREEALAAIQKAKETNPNDLQILKAEAIVYQKMGDTAKYKAGIKHLITADKEHASKYYNLLGDGAIDAGKIDEAAGYYQNAIKAAPEDPYGYRGMANVYLTKQKKIVDEMNQLGMSKADVKKYNELSKQRKEMLQKAIPYLEKDLQYDAGNQNVINKLFQLNRIVGNKEAAQKYKNMLKK